MSPQGYKLEYKTGIFQSETKYSGKGEKSVSNIFLNGLPEVVKICNGIWVSW